MRRPFVRHLGAPAIAGRASGPGASCEVSVGRAPAVGDDESDSALRHRRRQDALRPPEGLPHHRDPTMRHACVCESLLLSSAEMVTPERVAGAAMLCIVGLLS
jgi:hypothetical protein